MRSLMRFFLISVLLVLCFSACQERVVWPLQNYEVSQRQALTEAFVKEVKSQYSRRHDGVLHGPYAIRNGMEFSYDLNKAENNLSKEIVHIIFTTSTSKDSNQKSYAVYPAYKVAAFCPNVHGPDVKKLELAKEISANISKK